MKWLTLLLLLVPSLAWGQPSPTVALDPPFTSGSNLTVYTTGSFSITANRLAILVSLGVDVGGSSSPPSVTGHGTWRVVGNGINTGQKYHVWCKDSGAGSTDTIELDFTGVGDAQNSIMITVVEWSGADLTGNCEDKILQKNQHLEASAGGTSTVTFDAFSDSNNRPFLVINKGGALGSATNDWTELFDASAESTANYGTWNNSSADTDVIVDWSNNGAAVAIGLKMEIPVSIATGDIQMGTGMASGGFID